MKIKNTDGSYCKIKDIKVTGLTAYVTLIIYSSIPQVSEDILGNIHRVFSFYLRDKDSTELYRLSHNNYWIDRNNNYNNDNTNIDINMYKEVILTIDITNNNKSEMTLNKWIRKCNIVMIDHTVSQEEVWISEDLELISKEIELPTFTNFKISKGSEDILLVSFDLNYNTQEDFNYINKNLITRIEIIPEYSGIVSESLDFDNATNNFVKYQTFKFCSLNSYNEPLTVKVSLLNLKEETLKVYKEFFNPDINSINLYVKGTTSTKVLAVSILESNKNVHKISNIQIK